MTVTQLLVPNLSGPHKVTARQERVDCDQAGGFNLAFRIWVRRGRRWHPYRLSG